MDKPDCTIEIKIGPSVMGNFRRLYLHMYGCATMVTTPSGSACTPALSLMVTAREFREYERLRVRQNLSAEQKLREVENIKKEHDLP